MDRTGHSTVTGVRNYKRKVSDVLNTANKVGKSAEHSVDDQISNTQRVSSGNLPSINVSGGPNIT